MRDSQYCEECGAPDDGTQSYCLECRAPLIEEAYMQEHIVASHRNETRALRVSRMIAAAGYEAATPREALTDLMVDARHFAEREGLDFDDVSITARNHYQAEAMEADI